MGMRIVYPLTDEPWGVRRFFVEDPDGHIVNVLAHIQHERTSSLDDRRSDLRQRRSPGT
jgi:hypothetical protein